MNTPVPVGLVGVTGYTGMELLRLLLEHPSQQLVVATSRSEQGRTLGSVYPFLQKSSLAELVIANPDPEDIASRCKLVYLAVPHGTAMEMASELVARGVKVVDLSADFRLRDVRVYEQWYQVNHTQSPLLEEAVYGLPEIYRDQIVNARLVANPGCYPTSALLGLYPVLKQGVVSSEDLVIDSKSGTSGAGRSAKVGSLFCEVADSFRAYNLAAHRHTPEIEQELALAAGQTLHVSFNTHLLPIGRGILSTIYTKLERDLPAEELHEIYASAYREHVWVRVLPLGTLPETRWVRGTNHCDIGLVKDDRTGRLIIVTAIDNLCRGASGQALVNANIMLGMDPDLGLPKAPLVP